MTCSSCARGRLGVAIGDVVGHGVRAAALMGQLRTALHAYAMQDYGPARTLELVDRYVQAMPDYAMATAAYAVLEPDTGEMQIASAGHLPPVVVSRDGGRVVDITPSAPLGAFSYGRVQEQELLLAPGETLVFYTDGLVERPGTPLNGVHRRAARGVDRARCRSTICAGAPSTAWSRRGRLRDDVAIVAIQNSVIDDESGPASARRPQDPGRDQAGAAALAPAPGRQRLTDDGDHARGQRGLHQRHRARLLAGARRVQPARHGRRRAGDASSSQTPGAGALPAGRTAAAA